MSEMAMNIWAAGIVIGVGLAVGFMSLVMHAAYCNGVTDGYGYSQEPGNPGYHKAGLYLRCFLSHRWPRLKEIKDGDLRTR